MIPGSTGPVHSEFPPSWLGLWKDRQGKIILLSAITSKSVEISIFQGINLPPFPLTGGEMSCRIPAVFSSTPGEGPVLRFHFSDEGEEIPYLLRFQAPEGSRLRFAEPWDVVNLLQMMPYAVNPDKKIHLWEPVSPFIKANEEWPMFSNQHPDWE